MPSPVIDYSQCLRDSPKFRQQLGLNESSLDELEVSQRRRLLCVLSNSRCGWTR